MSHGVKKAAFGAGVALVAAVLANGVVFLICTKWLGLTMALYDPDTHDAMVMSLQSVVGASTVPAIGAAVLLAVLLRYSRRAFFIFFAVSGALVVLSLVPVFLADVNAPSTRIVMSVMHVVAAGAIVGALTWVYKDARGV